MTSRVSATRADPSASVALVRARGAPLRFAAGALALAGADVAIDPVHTHVPLCPLHSLTGWWCPFCGSLRAVDELARGHFGAALHDNLLLVSALPVALAFWWAWVLRARAGDGAPRRSPAAPLAVMLLLVAFAVVRNLPFAVALRPGS